jgi:hypothetical protein
MPEVHSDLVVEIRAQRATLLENLDYFARISGAMLHVVIHTIRETREYIIKKTCGGVR